MSSEAAGSLACRLDRATMYRIEVAALDRAADALRGALRLDRVRGW
jgi:hypothetical protein